MLKQSICEESRRKGGAEIGDQNHQITKLVHSSGDASSSCKFVPNFQCHVSNDYAENTKKGFHGFVSTPASMMEKVHSRSSMASESNVVAPYERNTTTKEIKGSTTTTSCYWFWAAANAPYQVNPPSPAAPKPEESIPWIEVGVQSSNQLELKL
uniref:Uncharacterized protein n=1 Tax=Quercus lobata TaxID=97700 RepID=A0A7N2LK64_QUELO